jgi:hypothetical protein
MAIWRIIAFALGLGAMALAGLYTLAVAQDQEELEERSALVEFVERIISTPDRQIRLGTISGALSSNVSFSEITIADRGGVWLRIDNVHLVWSRTALILGRLEISQLEADAIVMERRPLPPEDEIPEEARLTVPELPVATNIERLAVPRVSFGEDVFGRQPRIGRARHQPSDQPAVVRRVESFRQGQGLAVALLGERCDRLLQIRLAGKAVRRRGAAALGVGAGMRIGPFGRGRGSRALISSTSSSGGLALGSGARSGAAMAAGGSPAAIGRRSAMQAKRAVSGRMILMTRDWTPRASLPVNAEEVWQARHARERACPRGCRALSSAVQGQDERTWRRSRGSGAPFRRW